VSDDLRVADNPAEQRYEAWLDEQLVGVLEYRPADGLVALVHTEVEPGLRRGGVGTGLVTAALDDLRSRDAKILPLCSFVRAFVHRHAEYEDLVGTR
jgi:predicted GNAT family acetyltransferase